MRPQNKKWSVSAPAGLLQRIATWLFFTVLFSLLPLAAYGLVLMNRGKLIQVSDTWCRGEVVLVASSLMATATGLLFSTTIEIRFFKEAVGAIAVVIIVLGIAWWVDIAANAVSGTPSADVPLRLYSPWFFGIALITSLACVMLSKEGGTK